MIRKEAYLLPLALLAILVTPAFALIMPFGQDDFKRAGEGCVAGHISSGANTAYYRGNTDLLNRKLRDLHFRYNASASMELRIHRGFHRIQNENEKLIDVIESGSSTIPVDWCIMTMHDLNASKRKAFDWRNQHQAVQIPMRLKSDVRILVDIWIGESIDLKLLDVPYGFVTKQIDGRYSASHD